MKSERKKIANKLKTDPVSFGRHLGFTKLGQLHNEWIIDMVFGDADKTLQAHRGSYKTTCVSIALTLIIILFPNDRTMFMRKTDTDVKEVIKQVIKMLDAPFTRLLVKQLWGVDLVLNTASAYEVSTNLTNDPRGSSQLIGQGMGGSLTGKHYDRIFTDDIVNLKDRKSRAEREETKLIYQELQNIKNRGGRIFNTGTPWHKEDAFELMPNITRYDCYTTGLMTAEELQEVRNKMSPSLFCANYELRHIASEDVIFTDPQIGADIQTCMNGIAHVDSAFYGEDYTALTIMAKHDGKYYVFGKIWRKHVEDCYTDIKSYYDSLLSTKLYNETNADKGMIAKEMRKQGMRVVTYHEKMNKYLKIVTYLKAIWSDVVFVEGTDNEYINQICDYTEDAEHDDAPDSCSCLARLLLNKDTNNSNSEYKPLWN